MKKQSRTVPRRRQSVSPTPRHLPLVTKASGSPQRSSMGFYSRFAGRLRRAAGSGSPSCTGS